MKTKQDALFSLVVANANAMRYWIENSNLSEIEKENQLEELRDRTRARLYSIIQNRDEK